jgi:hypothetical protein
MRGRTHAHAVRPAPRPPRCDVWLSFPPARRARFRLRFRPELAAYSARTHECTRGLTWDAESGLSVFGSTCGLTVSVTGGTGLETRHVNRVRGVSKAYRRWVWQSRPPVQDGSDSDSESEGGTALWSSSSSEGVGQAGAKEAKQAKEGKERGGESGKKAGGSSKPESKSDDKASRDRVGHGLLGLSATEAVGIGRVLRDLNNSSAASSPGAAALPAELWRLLAPHLASCAPSTSRKRTKVANKDGGGKATKAAAAAAGGSRGAQPRLPGEASRTSSSASTGGAAKAGAPAAGSSKQRKAVPAAAAAAATPKRGGAGADAGSSLGASPPYAAAMESTAKAPPPVFRAPMSTVLLQEVDDLCGPIGGSAQGSWKSAAAKRRGLGASSVAKPGVGNKGVAGVRGTPAVGAAVEEAKPIAKPAKLQAKAEATHAEATRVAVAAKRAENSPPVVDMRPLKKRLLAAVPSPPSEEVKPTPSVPPPQPPVVEKKQRTTGKRKPRKKEAKLPIAPHEAAATASPGSPFATKLVWGNALAMVGTPHSPSSPAPTRTAAVCATSAPAATTAATDCTPKGTTGVNGVNSHDHTITMPTPSYAAHPALMNFHKHQQERTLLDNAAAACPTQVVPTTAAATTTSHLTAPEHSA